MRILKRCLSQLPVSRVILMVQDKLMELPTFLPCIHISLAAVSRPLPPHPIFASFVLTQSSNTDFHKQPHSEYICIHTRFKGTFLTHCSTQWHACTKNTHTHTDTRTTKKNTHSLTMPNTSSKSQFNTLDNFNYIVICIQTSTWFQTRHLIRQPRTESPMRIIM